MFFIKTEKWLANIKDKILTLPNRKKMSKSIFGCTGIVLVLFFNILATPGKKCKDFKTPVGNGKICQTGQGNGCIVKTVTVTSGPYKGSAYTMRQCKK